MARQPLYMQLKIYLLELIKDNMDDQNYMLPSENTLCARFNISRITAKKALSELYEEGYIIRKRGKGSFINTDGAELFDFPKQESKKEFRNESVNVFPVNKKSKKLLLILPNLESSYYVQVLYNVIYEAKKYEYSVILGLSNNIQEEESAIISKNFRDVSGIIIAAAYNNVYNQGLVRLILKRYPIVFIDNNLLGLDVTAISSDNYRAIHHATAFLIKKGCKNIAFITKKGESNLTLSERFEGYKDALNSSGIPYREELILNNLSHGQIVYGDIIKNFLTDAPLDGIVAASSGIGIRILEQIERYKIKVPLSNIVIYDNEFETMRKIGPISFNYIQQDASQIGRLAVDLLIEQQNGDKLNKHIRIPAELVVGGAPTTEDNQTLSVFQGM